MRMTSLAKFIRLTVIISSVLFYFCLFCFSVCFETALAVLKPRDLPASASHSTMIKGVLHHTKLLVAAHNTNYEAKIT